MTALQIIKKSAMLLNVNEILTDTNLDSVSENNSDTVLSHNSSLNRMFEILKILLLEISTEYLPLYKEGEYTAVDNKISLNSITDLYKVLQVKINNVPVKYKIIDGYINLNYSGECKVRYKAKVDVTYLTDSIDSFNNAITVDLLVYGVISLYCLASGMFDEHNAYNTIYQEKLSAMSSLKILDMPVRSWK